MLYKGRALQAEVMMQEGSGRIYSFIVGNPAPTVEEALWNLLHVTMCMMEKDRANTVAHLAGTRWLGFESGYYLTTKR